MNYIKITKTDIANGNGIRCVLWVAGCDLHCKGCHNPESWDFCAGKPFDDSAMEELVEAISKPWIKGLTLSGGHPIAYENLSDVYEICKVVKEKYPNKDIWLYTGYTYEELYYKEISRILLYIDVLVDGPYIEEQRDITLSWRGSKNQRVIDVKETLEQGKVVTIC